MPKRVEFEKRSNARVRIVMIERDSSYRVISKRQFMVEDWVLKQALRAADLVETKTVTTPATTEAEQLELANEIAWYTSNLDRTGGTPSTASIRNRLWVRINKKLGLD